MLDIEYPIGESAEGFRFPAPPQAARNFGSHSPRSMRGSIPFDNRLIECESGLEAKTVYVFLGRSDVVDIREQPPRLRFIDDAGDECWHYVDLIVTFSDGTRYAVLVKPLAKVESSGLRRIRDLLAAQAPRSFADYYVIVSEDKLPRTLVFNGRKFADVRLHGPFSGHPDVRAMHRVVTQRMTVAAAIERANLDGRGFRALVRCAIDGHVRLVGRTRWDSAAVVEPVVACTEGRS